MVDPLLIMNHGTIYHSRISNGDGTYRTESFGEEGYFHDVDIHRDQNGNVNIIIGDDDDLGLIKEIFILTDIMEEVSLITQQ